MTAKKPANPIAQAAAEMHAADVDSLARKILSLCLAWRAGDRLTVTEIGRAHRASDLADQLRPLVGAYEKAKP